MMSISMLGLIFIAVVIGLIIVGAVVFLFMQERGRGERDDQPPK
jgi:Tfp pilus assembly protein PilW